MVDRVLRNSKKIFFSYLAHKYSQEYETLASLDTSTLFPEKTEEKKDN